MARKRKPNPRRVKARRSYTWKELADLLGVHERTAQGWKVEGLQMLDETTKPYLVMGDEVKRFLKERSQRRKHPLRLGEFFCATCRQARQSAPHALRVEYTGKRLGKHGAQALLRGICQTCQRPLLLFSSAAKVRQLRENVLLPPELKIVLNGYADTSVNTDMELGERDES